MYFQTWLFSGERSSCCRRAMNNNIGQHMWIFGFISFSWEDFGYQMLVILVTVLFIFIGLVTLGYFQPVSIIKLCFWICKIARCPVYLLICLVGKYYNNSTRTFVEMIIQRDFCIVSHLSKIFKVLYNKYGSSQL